MILFRVMRRIPCTIVGIYDRYQLDVKSDIEWLLQKAAFDESENDKLHRIRVSFENELNEIRAQLQQLKECADLQETLDTLDAKLSLVTSISTEEKTSIIRHRVDALKRRVFEALTEQSNAEGVSNPVDPAKNEGENALCRSRSALQHSSSCSQKGNLLSDEEDSLPCESGRMKSLDAFRELFSYSASIIHRVSHSSQEKEATDNAKAGARTSSSVNSTLRPKQAILTKCLTRSFSQGHQHVSLPSALAIASHTPVRKVDLSLSDPTIQSTQVAPNHSSRSPPPHPPSPPALLRQASSLSRPSSPPPSPPIHRIRSLSTQMSPSSLVFHHRSPPPSPPIHRIRSSSTQISPPSSPVPHPRPPQPPSCLIRSPSSGKSSTSLPEPPNPSSIPTTQPPPIPTIQPSPIPVIQPSSPEPLAHFTQNPLSSSIHFNAPLPVAPLEADVPSHQQDSKTPVESTQFQTLSNQLNPSESDRYQNPATFIIEQSDNMTLPTETKTSIDNQDITSSEQPIIIQNQVINQNEHQPPFTTATDKNYDDSHPVDKKNNQMESVCSLWIFHVGSCRYRRRT